VRASMIRLIIDGKTAEVPPGSSVLDAAEALGIRVPALCREPGREPLSNCMVCLVKDASAGRLVPACACPAGEGMVVETGGEAADARREAVEFLLSEHAGDCEGLCRRACPARLDMPRAIRRIREGDLAGALAAVREEIALPASIALSCTAPCEKACRRSRHDGAVSVRLLHRIVGEAGLAPGAASPRPGPPTGRRVAVAGAGPAGLSAAFFLRLAGHACTVFDEGAEPGGELRRGTPEAVLPRRILDAEIGAIRDLGAEFRMGTRIGRDLGIDGLRKGFDAVVLAVGAAPTDALAELGAPAEGAAAGATALPGVFSAGGGAPRSRFPARSAGEGKAAARAADRFVLGRGPGAPGRRFDSRLGPLLDGEMEEFLKEADPAPRVEPAAGPAAGFSADEARREALRCLRCDCRKKDDCRLREIAEQTGAGWSDEGEGRRRFERDLGHRGIVFEPGKCILCGICVRIAREAGEPLGFAFLERGFRTRVGVPFDEPLSEGLMSSAAACARACPTGALALRDAAR
jgi:ferredoxin